MVDLDHLSYSSISAYLACPRAWEYRYVQKIKTTTAPALAFGSAFHATLEHVIRNRDSGYPKPIGMVWHEKWSEATKQEIAWNGETPEKLSNDGIRMFSCQETETLLNRLTPDMRDDKPMLEHRCELHVPGVPIPIIGYIDIITNDGVPCDFKTAAKSWSQDQAAKESQPLFYLAALNQMYGSTELRFRHYVWVKTKTPQVQTFEVMHTFGKVFRLFNTIQEVWQGITSGVFPCNTGTWKCGPKWCEFHDRCQGV